MGKLLGDIYLEESGGTFRFGNGMIELRFDASNGGMSGISCNKRNISLTPPQPGAPLAELRVGGRIAEDGRIRNGRRLPYEGTAILGSHAAMLGYRTIYRRNCIALEIVTSEDDWEIASIFTMEHGGDTVRRDLRLMYCGEGEMLLRDVRLNLPVICIGNLNENNIQAPNYPVVPDFPVHRMPPGLWPALDSENSTVAGRVQHNADAPGCIAGLVGISNAREPACLQVWAHTEAEMSLMEAYKTEEGVRLSQLHLLADRFAKGEILEAGSQYIRVYGGGWRQAMESFREWYEKAGLSVPQDSPRWADGIAIYEAHIGKAYFADGKSYGPYPDMRDLIVDLPRIRAMGFEAVQLMPRMPFCGYTVHRYEDIDRQYGDAEGFREMIAAAHTLGMRVILDIVMHGPVDKEIVRRDIRKFGYQKDSVFNIWLEQSDDVSVYRSRHPEWFMQNEDGEASSLYTWAFDHANPGFQNYFISTLKWYLREFQVDGFRFDAPQWNSIPNWRRDLPDRASSSYYASYPLLARARKEIKAEFPDALLYTEPSGPLYRHCMDCCYNYDEEWLTGSLFPPKAIGKYAGSSTYTGRRPTGREVAEWFHYKRLALPDGSMTVHHLDSHDTFWWGDLAQFRHEAIGDREAHAMFSVFALIGGGIMNYAGAEKGSEEFYSGLLKQRQNVPELRFGQCDFLSARSGDENVFLVIRALDGRHTLAAVNIGREASNALVSVPLEAVIANPAGKVCARRLFGSDGADWIGEPAQSEDRLVLRLTLPPYGTILISMDGQ
jgi:hypothetical protein